MTLPDTNYTKATLPTTNYADRGGDYWRSEFGIAQFDMDRFDSGSIATNYTKATLPTTNYTKL